MDFFVQMSDDIEMKESINQHINEIIKVANSYDQPERDQFLKTIIDGCKKKMENKN